MYGLLGQTVSGKDLPPLPAPLEAGETRELRADGKPRHYPEWLMSLATAVNKAYVDEAIELIVANKNVSSYSGTFTNQHSP